MDEPFCVLVESNDLLSFGNKSLRLSEAFVVWEPISQVHDVQVPDQLLNIAKSTLKHSFLVFVLEPGQMLYGSNYRYMRVERQQPPVAEGTPPSPDLQEALLNIRFCKTLLGAKALDIPGVDASAVTADDLERHGVLQCGQGVDFKAERITLYQLLEVATRVHSSKQKYSLTDANCIWFVDEVLGCLLEKVQTEGLKEGLDAVLADFKQHPRTTAAREFGSVVKQASKGLKHWRVVMQLLPDNTPEQVQPVVETVSNGLKQSKAWLMGCLASKASTASARVSGAGVAYKVKRASADAFAFRCKS